MLPISISVTCVLTRKNRVDTIVSGDIYKKHMCEIKSSFSGVACCGLCSIYTRNYFINVCLNSCVLLCQLKVLAKVLGKHPFTTYCTRCTRGSFWTQFSVLLPGYGSIWTTNRKTK